MSMKGFGKLGVDAVADLRGRAAWMDDAMEEPVPSRSHEFRPLGQLTTKHMTATQAEHFNWVLGRAREWIQRVPSSPGLGFVLTGPTGIGKTSIGENLMNAFMTSVDVLANDDDGYRDIVRKTIAAVEAGKYQVSAETLAEMRRQLEAPTESVTARVGQARFVPADELMDVVHNGQLEQTYGMRTMGDQPAVRCVLIDDAGDEVVPFTRSEDQKTRRQQYYRQALDYFARTRKHVIITSMTPLMLPAAPGEEPRFNPEFWEIFGEAGKSRLIRAARGFMVDMSGIPEYRSIEGSRAYELGG